jgi:hypothetical protein
MLLGVITYYAKGGVRAVENMIPFDEDEDNKGGVTVDRSKEGEDLPLRVFTLDDNNSDAGDAKNALERTLSLKPHPTEHNDPFDSDGEDSKNSKDRSNAASKIN